MACLYLLKQLHDNKKSPLMKEKSGIMQSCRGEVIGSGDAGREVMAGVGVGPNQAQQGRPGDGALPPPPKLTAVQLKLLLKRQKKEVKEARRRDRKARISPGLLPLALGSIKG